MIKLLLWAVSTPMLALIGLYKFVISPLTPPSCRHYPTCSTYAGEAIKEWGPWTGSWLSLKRLSRCHPWGTSGMDPVPKKCGKAPNA